MRPIFGAGRLYAYQQSLKRAAPNDGTNTTVLRSTAISTDSFSIVEYGGGASTSTLTFSTALQPNDLVIYYGGRDTSSVTTPNEPAGYDTIGLGVSSPPNITRRVACKWMGAVPDTQITGLRNDSQTVNAYIVVRGATGDPVNVVEVISSENPAAVTVPGPAVALELAFVNTTLPGVAASTGYTIISSHLSSGGKITIASKEVTSPGVEDPDAMSIPTATNFAIFTTYFTANVALTATYTATASLAAALQKQGLLRTVAGTAALQKAGVTASASAAAALSKSLSAICSGNSALQKLAVLRTASAQAAVQRQGVLSSLGITSALQRAGITSSASSSAALLKLFSISASASANLILGYSTITVSTSASAALQKVVNKLVFASAALQLTRTVQVSIARAALQRRDIQTWVFCTAALAGTELTVASANAALAKLCSTTTSITAALVFEVVHSISVGAALQKNCLTVAQVSAIVSRTGWDATGNIAGSWALDSDASGAWAPGVSVSNTWTEDDSTSGTWTKAGDAVGTWE